MSGEMYRDLNAHLNNNLEKSRRDLLEMAGQRNEALLEVDRLREKVAGYWGLCGQLGKRYSRLSKSWDLLWEIWKGQDSDYNLLQAELAELKGRVCDRCKYIRESKDNYRRKLFTCIKHPIAELTWDTSQNGCTAWKEKE